MGVRLRDVYGLPTKHTDTTPHSRPVPAALAPLRKAAAAAHTLATVAARSEEAARTIEADRAKRDIFLRSTVPLSSALPIQHHGRLQKGGFKHVINGRDTPITAANAAATLRQRTLLLPREAAMAEAAAASSPTRAAADAAVYDDPAAAAGHPLTVPQRMRRHLLVLSHIQQDKDRHHAYQWLSARTGLGCSIPSSAPANTDEHASLAAEMSVSADGDRSVHDDYATLANRYIKGLLRDYEDVDIDPDQPLQWPVCDPLSLSMRHRPRSKSPSHSRPGSSGTNRVSTRPGSAAASVSTRPSSAAASTRPSSAAAGARPGSPVVQTFSMHHGVFDGEAAGLGAAADVEATTGSPRTNNFEPAQLQCTVTQSSKRQLRDILGSYGAGSSPGREKRKYTWKPPKKKLYRPSRRQRFLFDKTLDPYVRVTIPRPGSAMAASVAAAGDASPSPATPSPQRTRPNSAAPVSQSHLGTCKEKARKMLDPQAVTPRPDPQSVSASDMVSGGDAGGGGGNFAPDSRCTSPTYPTPLAGESAAGNVPMSPTRLPSTALGAQRMSHAPVQPEADYLDLASDDEVDLGSAAASSTTVGD